MAEQPTHADHDESRCLFLFWDGFPLGAIAVTFATSFDATPSSRAALMVIVFVWGQERKMRVVRSLIAFLLATLCLTIPAYAQTNPSAERVLETGRTALQQQNYAEAIRLLEEGLKQFPNERKLKLELGRAYLYNRQDDLAIRLFREILREEPSNRTAKLELARALG